MLYKSHVYARLYMYIYEYTHMYLYIDICVYLCVYIHFEKKVHFGIFCFEKYGLKTTPCYKNKVIWHQFIIFEFMVKDDNVCMVTLVGL